MIQRIWIAVMFACVLLSGCAQSENLTLSTPESDDSTQAVSSITSAEGDEAPETGTSAEIELPDVEENAVSATGLLGVYKIPGYPGMELLSEEIDFEWPDIERKKSRLQFGEWEYYSSDDDYAAIAAYYRDEMPQEPWSKTEIAWIEIDEGVLGLWHDPHNGMWTRVWAVPRPGASGGSWIIIAVDHLGLAGC